MSTDESFIRKRSTDDHHIQTYSASGKRLRIISEASLATALNEDDEELEEEVQQVRVTSKHNLQPKVESLEFLDGTQIHAQQPTKQTQNITYMNMDSFTEKTNIVTSQQQQQHQTTSSREIVG